MIEGYPQSLFMLLWFWGEAKVTNRLKTMLGIQPIFMLPKKNLYELFGKGDFILYLCGEITHTITIPLL